MTEVGVARESPEHLEARRGRRGRRSRVIVKRWTFNQHQTDDEVRAYYEGLKIVSKPGARFGPPKEPEVARPTDVPLIDPVTGLLKRDCGGCGGWWVQTEPVKKRVGGTCACHPSASP